MHRLRLVIFIILASIAILPGHAQAAPAALGSFVVTDSSGDSLPLQDGEDPRSYAVTITQAQQVTIYISAPGLFISSGAYRRIPDELEMAVFVSDSSVVSVSIAGEGGTVTYTLHFSMEVIKDEPGQKPDQPGGQQPDQEDPDQDEPEDGTAAGESRPPEPIPAPGQSGQWPDAGGLAEEMAGRYPFQDSGAPAGNGEIRLYLRIGSAAAFINGQEARLDAAPYIEQDYTMVPLRFVAETLGAQVYWDGANRTVIIAFGGRVFDLQVGQPVPGYPVSAQLVNGRTFVPLRYVMESFGAEVSWDGANRSIDIIFPGF